MMQPVDPLSQLVGMCCGMSPRRRDFKNRAAPRGYFYSPSTAQFEYGAAPGAWPMANHPYMPQPQPYLLLTQPVIIANNPATASQTNTMTLVQHAQTASPNTAAFPTLPAIMASPSMAGQALHHHHQQQAGVITSQYAIYNTTAAAAAAGSRPATTMIAQAPNNSSQDHDTRRYLQQALSGLESKNQGHLIDALDLNRDAASVVSTQRQQLAQQDRAAVTLSSQIFKQIETIERQVDLSEDMEIIQAHGIVITRALDPYSLTPHLTEATMRKYHNEFLTSDDYVIKFIEIIKRPGQTLGLYIRTVQFEDQRTRSSRAGLVITKVDSDSPIYNSQVLHVGDEILSINLVDIQGMSLDDVVVIMSIPRRLVLALRIPRYREQLLDMNLKQQQQDQRNLARNSEHQQHQQQQQLEQRLELRASRSPIPMRQFDYATRQTSMSDLDLVSSNNQAVGALARDAFVERELSRLEQDLYQVRPARVHSALGLGYQVEPSISEHPSCDPRLVSQSFQQAGSPVHADQSMAGQQYSTGAEWAMSGSLDRPKGLLAQHQHHGGVTAIPTTANLLMRHQQDRLDRLVGQPSVVATIATSNNQALANSSSNIRVAQGSGLPSSGCIGEYHSGSSSSSSNNNNNNNNNNGDIHQATFRHSVESSELAWPQSLTGPNKSDRCSLSLSEQLASGKLVSSSNRDSSNASNSVSVAASTLPRRTLPSRPNALISSPPEEVAVGNIVKQPVISNIRLGETPEQSSYFSSSINAINRELKELRRQRLAFGNNPDASSGPDAIGATEPDEDPSFMIAAEHRQNVSSSKPSRID